MNVNNIEKHVKDGTDIINNVISANQHFASSSILGDPGAVSRVGRKGETKVVPFLPTLLTAPVSPRMIFKLQALLLFLSPPRPAPESLLTGYDDLFTIFKAYKVLYDFLKFVFSQFSPPRLDYFSYRKGTFNFRIKKRDEKRNQKNSHFRNLKFSGK